MRSRSGNAPDVVVRQCRICVARPAALVGQSTPDGGSSPTDSARLPVLSVITIVVAHSRMPSPGARREMLEATGLSRRFGSRWVVDDVSLTVRRGEIVGLLGPNGAGKTVTFYMISGLLQPDAGHIVIDGLDVTHMPMDRRSRCGMTYLTQERSVFHRLTAEDNIAGILEMHGHSRQEARHRAIALLAQFGLARLAATQAGRLSGGEQRRLEVARAVATEPHYLLSDEPFTGIDPKTIEMLHELFVSLRSDGMGILLTDHNVTETLALCDRAYVMFAGQVLAHGTPAELQVNPVVRHLYLGDAASVPGPAASTLSR
ncbi:MAG TPA: LPS export ABC transporter ATP-binding protein [Gemmatimonadaceae bacterium]